MKIYLVGGYVRDKILGLKNSDKDYVVVGSTPKEMEELGFKSVGKSFPVFIHKEKEGEFALARSEKKTGKRHIDFEFDTKNISLKEDLKRRDFTINALALNEENGDIIDYFNGLEDIKNKIIRPVSDAFCEDPLRVLRAARFKALLGQMWKFDEKLYKYALQVKEDLQFLSLERVYMETKKALQTDSPWLFFESLRELKVLDVIFPWLFNLTKIEHNNVYHLEGSIFNHVMLALRYTKDDINASWCVLFHDVGKFEAFKEDGNFYRHYAEKFVQNAFKEILKTLNLTKEEEGISRFFVSNHHKLHAVFENSLKPSKMATFLFSIKTKKRLKTLLKASMADMQGRDGEKKILFFTCDDILQIYDELKNTDYEVCHKTMSKEQIVAKIQRKQNRVVKNFICLKNRKFC